MAAAAHLGHGARPGAGEGMCAGAPLTRGAPLYLVTTPYHLLLALAHAESGGGPATIVLFGRFPDCERYWQFLASDSWASSLHLRGVFGFLPTQRPRRRARRLLLETVRTQRPSQLFVFNDRNEVAQAALDAVFRQGGRRVCLEDGSSFYTDWQAPGASRWTTMRKRLFVARHWLPLRVLGTHPLVQEVRVLRPAVVRPELSARARPLDIELMQSPVLRRLAGRMVSETGATAEDCPETLILPGLEEDPGWSDALWRQRTGAASATVAFKYHPREARPDPLQLAGLARELPRHVAVELYYLAWGRAPRRIVGDGRSTTLLTAKLFDPDCEILGIYHGPQPAHAEAFSRLGIEMRTALAL